MIGRFIHDRDLAANNFAEDNPTISAHKAGANWAYDWLYKNYRLHLDKQVWMMKVDELEKENELLRNQIKKLEER